MGVANVSPNRIALALDISVGNLTYHFKTKSVLLETIYAQMMAASKDYLSTDSFFNLNDFRKALINFQQLQHSYRFFFHDMVFIIRKYPELGEKFKMTSLGRLEEGRKMVDHLIKTGRMLPEDGYINYDYFIHTAWMVNTFWVAQEQITGNPPQKKNDMKALDIIWNILWLYLTPKGQQEYNEINAYIS